MPSRKGHPNRPFAFKREIAAAACTPGISVAKLALEHGVNANLLFTWRRQYREGKFGPPDAAHLPGQRLAEQAIAASPPNAALTLLPVQAPVAQLDAIAASACIEVIFRNATVRICGVPEMAPLRAVLEILVRRS